MLITSRSRPPSPGGTIRARDHPRRTRANGDRGASFFIRYGADPVSVERSLCDQTRRNAEPRGRCHLRRNTSFSDQVRPGGGKEFYVFTTGLAENLRASQIVPTKCFRTSLATTGRRQRGGLRQSFHCRKTPNLEIASSQAFRKCREAIFDSLGSTQTRGLPWRASHRTFPGAIHKNA